MKESTLCSLISSCFATSLVVDVLLQANVHPIVDWYAIFVPAFLYATFVKVRAPAGLVSACRLGLCASANVSFFTNLKFLIGPCGSSYLDPVRECGAEGTDDTCRRAVSDALRWESDHRRCPVVELGGTGGSLYYFVQFALVYLPTGIAPAMLHITNSSDGFRKGGGWTFYRNAGIPVVAATLLVDVFVGARVYPLSSEHVVHAFLLAAAFSRYASLSDVWEAASLASIAMATVDLVRNVLVYNLGPCAFDGRDVMDCDSSMAECYENLLDLSASTIDAADCPINKVGRHWAIALTASHVVRFITIVVLQSFLLSRKGVRLFRTRDKRDEDDDGDDDDRSDDKDQDVLFEKGRNV